MSQSANQIPDVRNAIILALRHALDFACIIFPGEEEVIFYSSPRELAPKDNKRIILSSWLDERQTIIYNKLNAIETIAYLTENNLNYEWEGHPWIETTRRAAYIQSVSELIKKLEKSTGKCVVSTATYRQFSKNNDFLEPVDLWINILKSHRSDFRFIFYSSSTGAWMGASPEKLLSVNLLEKTLSTMALAGTRKHSLADCPWDEKNIKEHQIVAEYIRAILLRFGIKALPGKTVNRNYGPIDHLMTPFKCQLPTGVDPNEILSALNPTPALAGYPLTEALKLINDVESHPRRMYGGYIAYADDNLLKAYVNLRSMQFDSDGCCMYGGGGIIASSSPELEWEETRAKLQSFFPSEK